MILAETGLSFLGLGLRPPAISWGVLLQEGQNLRSVALAPWVLLPAVAVMISGLMISMVQVAIGGLLTLWLMYKFAVELHRPAAGHGH